MNLYGEQYYDQVLANTTSTKKIRTYGKESVKALVHFLNIEVNEGFHDYMDGIFEVDFYEKEELLMTKGKLVNSINIILKGSVEIYDTINDKKIPALVVNNGNFITSLNTIHNAQGALMNAVALKPCIVLKIRIDILRSNIFKSKYAEDIEKIISHLHVKHETFLHNLNIISKLQGEEKVVTAFQKFGNLFQNIPQNNIAKILGIQPETLSRLKNKDIVMD